MAMGDEGFYNPMHCRFDIGGAFGEVRMARPCGNYALLCVFDNPQGRDHHTRLYKIRRPLLYNGTTILRVEVTTRVKETAEKEEKRRGGARTARRENL